jgi:predicted ATP-dependent serine protease
MLLQACDGFAQGTRKSYFASGEMTQNAVIDYAQRLGIKNDNIALYGNPEGIDVEDLFEDVLAVGARFLVIDSLPVCTVSDVKGDIGSPSMMDAVIQMVSSFCQAKQRSCIIINHLNKGEDYSGNRKVKFLVDGLVRMDYHSAEYDEKGKPIGPAGGVRMISMDAKSRQGRADITALVELTDNGIGAPSLAAMRALSKFEIVRE